MKAHSLLNVFMLLVFGMLSACGPSQVVQPDAATLAPTVAAPSETPLPTLTTQPSPTPTVLPSNTAEPTQTPTVTPIPGSFYSLISQNVTVWLPPEWEVQEDVDVALLTKANNTIVMTITRRLEKFPQDLVAHSEKFVKGMTADEMLGLKGAKYESALGDSLIPSDGVEFRKVEYLFPNNEMSIGGNKRGMTRLWYYYAHDGVSGYVFTILGGTDDLELARDDIEGILRSADFRVSIENVGLAMAMLPGWQLKNQGDEWTSLYTADPNGNILASLLLFKLNDGMTKDNLEGHTPKVVALTAKMAVKKFYDVDAEFRPDRLVQLADGTEGIGVLATAQLNGAQHDFLFISIQTTQLGAILIFECQKGCFLKNKDSLDAFFNSMRIIP